MAFIYGIRNLVTGKMYVGWTKRSVRGRFNSHVHAAMRCGENTIFYRAIRKYGPNNFIWGEIAEYPLEDILAMEKYHIKEMQTKNPLGYNTSEGGAGSPGAKHTPETMRRLREVWASEKFRTRMKEINADPDVKRRMSDGIKLAWTDGKKREQWVANMRKYHAENKEEVRRRRQEVGDREEVKALFRVVPPEATLVRGRERCRKESHMGKIVEHMGDSHWRYDELLRSLDQNVEFKITPGHKKSRINWISGYVAGAIRDGKIIVVSRDDT